MNAIKSILTAAAAAMLVASLPVQANDGGTVLDGGSDVDVIVCAELDLDGLRRVMQNYVTFASDDGDGKDRKLLNVKLDEAQEKLELGKLCDAAQKVDDFATKIDNLLTRGTKPKVFDEHGGAAVQCLLVGAEHLAARYRDGLSCGGDPPRGNGPK